MVFQPNSSSPEYKEGDSGNEFQHYSSLSISTICLQTEHSATQPADIATVLCEVMIGTSATPCHGFGWVAEALQL